MAGGTIAAARLAVGAGARLPRRPGGRRGRRAAPRRRREPRRRIPSRLPVARRRASVSTTTWPWPSASCSATALIRRAAVVDADVHQGNGTAFIFDGDPSVFTFSIHQEHNYPHVKPRGSLDVGLADGTGDGDYLRALERALPAVLASRPDLIFYVAGADPFVEDQLGGLCLTFEGLRGRDFLVLSSARDAGVPVVIVFAGGYARRVEDTAAIHIATIEEAIRLGA